jgi:hypothetical protein
MKQLFKADVVRIVLCETTHSLFICGFVYRTKKYPREIHPASHLYRDILTLEKEIAAADSILKKSHDLEQTPEVRRDRDRVRRMRSVFRKDYLRAKFDYLRKEVLCWTIPVIVQRDQDGKLMELGIEAAIRTLDEINAANNTNYSFN